MIAADAQGLVATGITKHFGDRTVLDDVSVALDRGEWLCLVGPSGSGKTTLLSIIGGLLRPDAGVVEDRSGGQLPRVAWVLQTTNALGYRSVRDNAALGALADGLDEVEAAQRAENVLTDLGLGGLADEPARTLSGGERQRLAIARALTSTRPFLLADEPTGQLDRRTSQRVIGRMRAASQHVGVLLATHDEHLQAWCDRVLTLEDGQVRPT